MVYRIVLCNNVNILPSLAPGAARRYTLLSSCVHEVKEKSSIENFILETPAFEKISGHFHSDVSMLFVTLLG
jgi:hypothetical protein